MPLRCLVPALLLLALAAPARAQQAVVVTPFERDDSGHYEDLLTDELMADAAYEVVPTDQFLDELATFGVTVGDFLADPGLVPEVAEALRVDAFVHGSLDRQRRPRELTLEVYDGGNGLSMGQVTVPLGRDGEPDPQTWGDALFELAPLIDQTQGPAHRESEPVAEPEPEPEPEPVQRAAPAHPAAPAEPAPSHEGWLRLSGGLDVVQRNFTLNAADAGIQYESGFYPGLEGAIELYPVRFFAPGVLDGLGIRFRVAHYFVSTVLVLEEGAPDLDIPTRHKELGIGLLYRHTLGRFELLGSLSWEHLAFTLGDNPVYESSEYDGVAIAIGAFYEAVRDLLRVGLGFEIRPAPSLGDSEVAAFGPGDAFGFGFRAGVEVTPLPRFALSAFYGFRRYSDTFDGTGTSDLTGTLDATDTFQQLGLRVGYYY